MELTLKTNIEIDIHPGIAILKIQDTELERIKFDSYTHDKHSVVFYVGGEDVMNFDYDVLRIW